MLTWDPTLLSHYDLGRWTNPTLHASATSDDAKGKLPRVSGFGI